MSSNRFKDQFIKSLLFAKLTQATALRALRSIALGRRSAIRSLQELRLWATWTPSVRNHRLSVTLEKPSDLDMRPVTGVDTVHKHKQD